MTNSSASSISSLRSLRNRRAALAREQALAALAWDSQAQDCRDIGLALAMASALAESAVKTYASLAIEPAHHMHLIQEELDGE